MGPLQLRAFFDGGYYLPAPGAGEISWYPSPFPAHPRDKVKAEVQRRNPGLMPFDIKSDWDLIDLYLRLEPGENPTEKMRERDYFGFNADRYIPSSNRDTTMRHKSSEYIKRFLALPSNDGCGTLGLNFSIYDGHYLYQTEAAMAEQEIRKLLVSP